MGKECRRLGCRNIVNDEQEEFCSEECFKIWGGGKRVPEAPVPPLRVKLWRLGRRLKSPYLPNAEELLLWLFGFATGYSLGLIFLFL